MTQTNQPTSPMKAIRAKCLDCCGYSYEEVKLCTVTKCALYPFRLGKNPFRTPRVLSDEQRAVMADRLRNARNSKSSLSITVDDLDGGDG